MSDLEKPYQINIIDRSKWGRGEPEFMKKGLLWYTDGSKKLTETGAGIVGTRPRAL